jgi:dipeptidyl aminopeptidase/acylaminoacyl peptidase
LTAIRKVRAGAAAVAIALSLAGSARAAAQGRASAHFDDVQLFGIRYLKLEEPVALSSDDRAIAITVEDRRRNLTPSGRSYTATGISTYYEGTSLTVIDTRTRHATAIAPGASSWGPSWAPDGSRLAFFSDLKGSAGVWVWDRRTRRTRRLKAGSPGSWTRPEWSADGRWLLVALTTAARDSVAPSRLVEVFSSRPAQGSDAPDLSSMRPNATTEVVLIDSHTGRTRVLARGPIKRAALSPDGRYVAYAVERPVYRPDGPRYAAYGDVVVVNTGTGEVTSAVRDVRISLLIPLSWSPASQQIAVGQDRGIYFVQADDSAATVHAVTQESAHLGLFGPLVWEPDGSGVYAVPGGRTVAFANARAGTFRSVASLDADVLTLVSRQGVIAKIGTGANRIVAVTAEDTTRRASFRVIDLATGSVSTRLAAEQQYGFGTTIGAQATTALLHDGRVVFVAQSASEPADIWIADDSLAHAEPLTHLNPGLASVALGERRVVTWTARGGGRVNGLLLLPAGYRQGARYPLIVWVYERSLRYANEFGLGGMQFYNLQQFASRGYAVLYPDIEWMRDSVLAGLGHQVLPGIDSLVAAGIVDSTRVGLIGHSSGGYDVMALLVQSSRFAAAVESAGAATADMFSEYTGQLDGIDAYDLLEKQMCLGAPPWGAPERYIRNSPGYFFDRITTPLLILQGTADPVQEKQSEAVFSGLRRLGKEVEFRRYPGEGHAPEWWSPAAKQDAHRRMLEWLDSRLRPGSAQATGGGREGLQPAAENRAAP